MLLLSRSETSIFFFVKQNKSRLFHFLSRALGLIIFISGLSAVAWVMWLEGGWLQTVKLQKVQAKVSHRNNDLSFPFLIKLPSVLLIKRKTKKDDHRQATKHP